MEVFTIGFTQTRAAEFFGKLAGAGSRRVIDRQLFSVLSVLLCSEKTADHCHRRLVCEYLNRKWKGLEAVHL